MFAQVCDEPHPLLVKEMIQHCVDANVDEAYKVGLLLLPPSRPRLHGASSLQPMVAAYGTLGVQKRASGP